MNGAAPELLDIAAMGERIAAGELSPVELVRAQLDRIEALDGGLRAYVSLYPEQAMDAASQAEREIAAGAYRGPLHGIPLAVKDLFQVAGMRRTCGSKILDEGVADSDATSVARLRRAGAIILGLLNLHEFAFGPTGINPHVGTARNPWSRDRVCGGSSSGSGCAVAASLAAGALGSDTGGSIRIPAALCGVVGLKQTYGLASRAGIYPLCASLDHGGPLTRTVRDAALLLGAIAGADDDDPTTTGAVARDYTAALAQPLDGLRIGVPRDFYFDRLHAEVAVAVQAAIGQLSDLGAAVEEVVLPFNREAIDAWNVMAQAEAYATHEGHLTRHGDELSPDVAERLLLGRDLTANQYLRARDSRMRINREMAAVLAETPVLALPTTALPAVPIETGALWVGDRKVEGWRALGQLTRLACFTGQPAISVPCGFTADGLPVGLQLLAGWFEEPTLLRVASAYEGATEWHRRRPPLAS
ncbi:MAG: amidase [Alphaproteobacteria bacterium]|mgnify:CR=1 FL=1|jgi:aspartyl-tRNA(Asn)/glutamyl-tRNA(Gln) amidotransferase subunit A|nr:amidase [Alphaproteobacteria bacterium]MDP6813915.1 amidase [Alphaproteobacteria bacterium]